MASENYIECKRLLKSFKKKDYWKYFSSADTFLFYLVDLSVEETCTMVKRILPIMKKKCKEIKILNLMNI